MKQHIAKITKAFIGFEDHGFLGWNLEFQLGTNTYQGTGVRFANNYQFGPTVEALLNAVGVNEWSQLEGKTVYVLKDDGDDWGLIKGIEKLPTESRGGLLIFENLYAELERKHAA